LIAWAAGYREAVEDHAGDISTIERLEREVHRMRAELRTARTDLDRARQTAAALGHEASFYFTRLQEVGVWDDELEQHKSAHRAARAAREQEAAARADGASGHGEYTGGPVEW
jgi:hypothetical protein